MRVRVRYETKDENGETRRERNTRFDVASPEIEFSEEGEYLIDWYDEISSSLNRFPNGSCVPIPWTEYKAWAEITETVVRPEEYAILRQIDLAYCDEMNSEISDYQARQMDKSKKR